MPRRLPHKFALVQTLVGRVLGFSRLWIVIALGHPEWLCSQATVVWTGAQNNDMSNLLNWNPTRIPNFGESAYFQQNVVFGSDLVFPPGQLNLDWTSAIFDSSPNFILGSGNNLILRNGVAMGRVDVTPNLYISGTVSTYGPTVVVAPPATQFPTFTIEDGGVFFIFGPNGATQSFISYICRDEGRMIYRGGALGGGANILMNTTGVGGIDTDGSVTLNQITSNGAGGQIQVRAGTLRIEGSSDLGLSQIFGAGGMTVVGSSVILRTNAIYTGPTQVSGDLRPGVIPLNGELRLLGDASLSSSAVELLSPAGTAGILSVETNASIRGLSGNGNVQFAAGNVLTVDQLSDTTHEGQIAGSGTLRKLGSGTLTLLGSTPISAALNVGGGFLAIDNQNRLPPSNFAVTLGGAGGLRLGNGVTITRPIGLEGIGGGFDVATGNLATFGGTISPAPPSGAQIYISGGGALNWTGSSNNAPFLVLNGGTLQVSGSSAISGSPLQLFGGTVKITSGGTYNSAITTTAGGTLNFLDIGSNALTLSGVVSGNGGLSKVGAGLLTIQGANTFSGGFNLTEGSAAVMGAGSIGTGSVNLSGTDSTLTASGIDASSLTIGSLSGGSGSSLVMGSKALSISSATSGEFSGVLSGSGGLTKSGAGNQALLGANTYSGTTSVAGGTLTINTANSLGVSTGLSLSSATLALQAGSSTVALSNTLPVALTGTSNTFSVLGAGDNLTLGGVISGLGAGFNKTGPGAMTLSAANTYTGGTVLSAGALILEGAGSLGTGSVVLGGGALQGGADGDLPNALSVLAASEIVAPPGSQTTFSGDISGTFPLRISGMGTVVLTNNNSGFTGGISVGSGATLRISASNNLGSGELTLSGGTLEASGSTTFAFPVDLENQAGVQAGPGEQLTLTGLLTGSGGLTIGGGGTVVLTGSNTYTGGTSVVGTSTMSVASSSNFSGPLTLNNGTVQITTSTTLSEDIHLQGPGVVELTGQAVELSGTVSGVGGLGKTGAGALTLSQANSFEGGLTISQGAVILNGLGSLGSGPLDLNGGDASLIASGSTAGSLSLGGLSGVAGSSVVMGTVPLDLNVQGQAVFAGSLSGSAPLTLTGSGSQALLGPSTYSGPILVDGSTLQIGSAASVGSSASVTLQNSTLQTAPGGSIVWPSQTALTSIGSNIFDVQGDSLSLPSINTTVGATSPGGMTKEGAGALALEELTIGNSSISPDTGVFTLASEPSAGPFVVDALSLGPVDLDLQPGAMGPISLGRVTMTSNGSLGSTSLQRSSAGPVAVTEIQLSDGSTVTNAASGVWGISGVVKSPAAQARPPAVLENSGGGLSVESLVIQANSAITDVVQSASTPLSVESSSVGIGATLRLSGAGAGGFVLENVSCQGTVQNDFPVVLSITDGLNLDGGLLRHNAGELDATGALLSSAGPSTLEVNGTATAIIGNISLAGGALILNNNSSAANAVLVRGSLNQTAPSTFEVQNSTGSSLEFEGPVSVSGLNLVSGPVVFDNVLQASQVTLSGGLTSVAQVQLGTVSLSNGSLLLTDAQQQTMERLIMISGQLEAEDGADVTIGALSQQGGTVRVNGTASVTIPGIYDFNGGTLQGPGLITVDELKITGNVTVTGELHVRDFLPGPGNIAVDITPGGFVEFDSGVNMGDSNILSAGRLTIHQDFTGGLIQTAGSAEIDGAFTMISGAVAQIGAHTEVGGPLTVSPGASFSTAAGGQITLAATAASAAGAQNLILEAGSSGLFAQGSSITAADQIIVNGTYSSSAAVSAGTALKIGGSFIMSGGALSAASEPIIVELGATLAVRGPGVVLSTPAAAGVQVLGALQVEAPLTINPTTNLTLFPSSLTRVSVAPTSAATISVAGTASLDGVLQPVFGTSRYKRGSSVTLLAAAGGLSGVFSSVQALPESFNRRIAVSYTPNEVVLTFLKGGGLFLVPCGSNQRCWVAGVQNWLETDPEGPLVDWIETVLDDVPVNCSCKALALLTGEPYSDLLPLSLAEARLSTQSIQKQIWRALDLWTRVEQQPAGLADGFGRFYPVKEGKKPRAERWRVWADGVGQYWRQAGEPEQALGSWKGSGSSVDFGADLRAGEKGLIGAAGTVQHSHGKVQERFSRLRLNGIGATLYGSVFDPENDRGPLSGAYVDGQVGGFGLQGRVNRSVHLAGDQQELSADVSGVRAQGRLELGQIWRAPRGAAQPYVAMEVGWSRFNDFSEGTESPIAVESPRPFDAYAGFVEVGARAYGVLPRQGWLLQPEMVWSVAHNFVQTRYEVPMRLTQIPGCGACCFRGLSPVENWVRLQLGAVAYVGNHIQIGLRGNVEGSERWVSAGGNLQVSVGF